MIRLLAIVSSLLLLASCDVFSKNEEPVTVVQYSGPTIDWGLVPPWSASADHGVLSLSFSVSSFEEFRELNSGAHLNYFEAGEQITLTLRDKNEKLPTFISLRRTVVSDYEGAFAPSRLGPMVKGIVYMENWNPNGVISGLVKGKLASSNIEVYFYADLGDSLTEKYSSLKSDNP